MQKLELLNKLKLLNESSEKQVCELKLINQQLQNENQKIMDCILQLKAKMEKINTKIEKMEKLNEKLSNLKTVNKN